MCCKNSLVLLLAWLFLFPLALGLSDPLFDVNVEIPTSYQIITAGEDLLASIKLVNVGSAGRIDIYLDYTIKDVRGRTLLTKLETVAVETQANFVRSFYIPPHTKPGLYTVETKLIYFNGKEAVSQATFMVEENPMIVRSAASPSAYQKVFYFLASLLVLDLLVLTTIKYVWPLFRHPKSFYSSSPTKRAKR